MRNVEPEHADDAGALVQAYVRAKWSESSTGDAPPTQLDPALRERIDALGFDAERLLNIGAAEVMTELSKLESEAAAEDATAKPAADSHRAREEQGFGAGGAQQRPPGERPAAHGRNRGAGNRSRRR